MNAVCYKTNGAKACSSPLHFKKLELSDRAVLDKTLLHFPQRISGFTFAALFSWAPAYHYAWAKSEDGTIFISCELSANGEKHFLQPVGPFGAEARDRFLHLLGKLGPGAKIFGVGAEFIAKNPDFASRFNIQNDRSLANYLYNTHDLAALGGKFYAKKRNLVAQAHKLYKYTVHEMTPENSRECLSVLEQPNEKQGGADQTFKNEYLAIEAAVKNFAALSQDGILIKVNDQAGAFSIFEALAPEISVIHFEKADIRHKGIYQIINQETAKTIAAKGIPYINREEDLGIAGLRQAKLSYGPMEIIPSYTLISTGT
jgi:hypothetical protein